MQPRVKDKTSGLGRETSLYFDQLADFSETDGQGVNLGRVRFWRGDRG